MLYYTGPCAQQYWQYWTQQRPSGIGVAQQCQETSLTMVTVSISKYWLVVELVIGCITMGLCCVADLCMTCVGQCCVCEKAVCATTLRERVVCSQNFDPIRPPWNPVASLSSCRAGDVTWTSNMAASIRTKPGPPEPAQCQKCHARVAKLCVTELCLCEKVVYDKVVCVCVWETLNQREKQGARGRIDGTGQRRPIYVVVKTYLHPKWQGGQAKNHPCRHAMTWHDMLM